MPCLFEELSVLWLCILYSARTRLAWLLLNFSPRFGRNILQAMRFPAQSCLGSYRFN